MNDISRAMEKKRAEKAKHRYEVGAESGADWGLTLIYQALHDKYGFGRNRFAKLNAAWEHLDSKEHGFSIRWRDELCDHFGFDRFLNERDAQRLERLITGKTVGGEALAESTAVHPRQHRRRPKEPGPYLGIHEMPAC